MTKNLHAKNSQTGNKSNIDYNFGKIS